MSICLYCDSSLPLHDADEVPDSDDDETWSHIAISHSPNCEWVRTRAHRLDGRDY